MGQIFIAGPWITEHEIKTVEKAMRDWYEKLLLLARNFKRFLVNITIVNTVL